MGVCGGVSLVGVADGWSVSGGEASEVGAGERVGSGQVK